MDRTASSNVSCCAATAIAFAWLPLLTGCHPGLLAASAVYMWEGGNFAPAECEFLEDQKVVVFCRPPASQEFRHAGASRQIAKRVGSLLRDNVPGIEVVPQRKVDEWIDENDSDDYEELGRAVKANLVVQIELGHFELFKGSTVYQGTSDVTINVYDMQKDGSLVWDKHLGEVLYPVHSGIAVQDKAVGVFQNEYVGILSEKVGKHFYKHDPNAHFAIDAMANR